MFSNTHFYQITNSLHTVIDTMLVFQSNTNFYTLVGFKIFLSTTNNIIYNDMIQVRFSIQ